MRKTGFKKKGNAVSLKNTVLYFRYLAGLNSIAKTFLIEDPRIQVPKLSLVTMNRMFE